MYNVNKSKLPKANPLLIDSQLNFALISVPKKFHNQFLRIKSNLYYSFLRGSISDFSILSTTFGFAS